jgi:hypothetical protein
MPATVVRLTVTNQTAAAVEADLSGWLENKICIDSLEKIGGHRQNQIVQTPHCTAINFTAQPDEPAPAPVPQPTIIFADFEGETFSPWKVEGEAFGPGPIAGAPNPEQVLTGFQGNRLANSWALKSDKPIGKLISPQFTIDHRFINFLIGGGNHPGQTCINLLIDGKVIRTATGKNTDHMAWESWPVTDWAGKIATLEIVDNHTGDWGHIEIDQIEFSDDSRVAPGKLVDQADFGSMCLALLSPPAGAHAIASEDRNIGRISCDLHLAPGASQTVTFAITWHFPNLIFAVTRWDPNHSIAPHDVIERGRHYATRFDSAMAVVHHLAENHERFYQQTKLWRDTWYDSTLPYWFLDRTLANVSTLATNTVYRFANGRFWGYEGVGSCRGTCTHVYGYEQSMGRLFPELDILLRDRTDYAAGFNPGTGAIGMRGEKSSPAVDGSCMMILRTLRDHQTSVDGTFLNRQWPNIKKAVQWLIAQDKNSEGILVGPQANTLDAEWFGAVPWISGLYLAALRAAEQMAGIMSDQSFATQCRSLLEAGQKNFVPRMWNGEYFVQIPDPKHIKMVGSFDGCEIDQVLGQSWAFQVGLGRVLPENQTKLALAALWKYNFAKDVGPFRAAHKPGRWFAMPGETGTLMCSWPRGEKQRVGANFDYYFNECMNGFEHQLAGHMIWEGMVQEGLAIERAVHDRYHASRRNPWNEIECGDHYARSMASFGVFLAACGFEYDGPAGHVGFAPRITPENFRSAFVTAAGWGTFAQQINGQSLAAQITVKWGSLGLKTIALALPEKMQPKAVTAALAGNALPVALEIAHGKARIELRNVVAIQNDQTIELHIHVA